MAIVVNMTTSKLADGDNNTQGVALSQALRGAQRHRAATTAVVLYLPLVSCFLHPSVVLSLSVTKHLVQKV